MFNLDKLRYYASKYGISVKYNNEEKKIFFYNNEKDGLFFQIGKDYYSNSKIYYRNY
jgi:hypothetical protein